VTDAKLVTLAPDTATGSLVACGTLLVERKLIRNAGCAGHVEDVVVDATFRGGGVGKLLLSALVAAARAAGCYKVILDCSEANTGFYAKCGFTRKEVQMALYL
jgi:glucosamine-phosphate N-acetyltransferase